MNESSLGALGNQFNRLHPGGIERLGKAFAEDLKLHPDKYQSIRSADLAKLVRQCEQLQRDYNVSEIPKAAERVTLTGLDVFCADQRRQIRGHLSQKLTAITNWEQYLGELGYERMTWALLRDPHHSSLKLALLLNDHRITPDRGWDVFLEELAALPEVGREEARQEIRNYQRTVGRLERTVAEQQEMIARLESRAVLVAPTTPSTTAQAAHSAQAVSKPDRDRYLQRQLEDKNEQLRTLRARVEDLEAQLKPTLHEAEGSKLGGTIRNAPTVLSFAEYLATHRQIEEYRLLDQFYRGRRIITIGGYSGNDPMGTTRNYLDFLRDSLGANVESLSTDINPQQLKGKLQGRNGSVVIHFTYCSSHKLQAQIQRAGIIPIRVGGTTYDEQAFIRQLLTVVPKDDQKR